MLDLRKEFYLVRIREGDEWKTAFNTPSGHYKFLLNAICFTNAPTIFQALVNKVLRDLINHFVLVYFDFSPRTFISMFAT